MKVAEGDIKLKRIFLFKLFFSFSKFVTAMLWIRAICIYAQFSSIFCWSIFPALKPQAVYGSPVYLGGPEPPPPYVGGEWLHFIAWAEAQYYSHRQSTTITHHLFIASTVWGQCFNFARPVLKLRMFVEKNQNMSTCNMQFNQKCPF